MAHVSPLYRLHQQAEASLLPYGPQGTDIGVVGTFGELELEYAAIRKACILLDQPQRGTIEVTGADRLGFLNRMVTQELKGFELFQVRRSFWLNRKGRIDADLRLIELGERTLLDLDAHAVARTLEGLAAFVITEDVHLRDVTAEMHRLALHGPTSAELFRTVSVPVAGHSFGDLRPGQACTVTVAGLEIIADRQDSTGELGFELLLKTSDVAAVYEHLLETGLDPDGNGQPGGNGAGVTSQHVPASRIRLRPAGWHAFNIARIEAGQPLYNLDFGPDSLPAETGVIEDRVSFTKGCYLGQEIVARMHSRGHSKAGLVALKLDDSPTVSGSALAQNSPQPETGSQIFPATGPGESGGVGDSIGVVTSSTPSPMLGSVTICFAKMKQEFAAAGTEVLVATGGGGGGRTLPAKVQPTLRFWSRG